VFDTISCEDFIEGDVEDVIIGTLNIIKKTAIVNIIINSPIIK
jgi:hypothetical protein